MNLTDKQATAAAKIKKARGEIEKAHDDIHKLAKSYIPDYHFMSYSVSSFWDCEKSPIGMCVYVLDQNTGRRLDCRYCSGPVERK